MRVLITGCDGFLGANLARHLLAKGHTVTGAALSRKGHTSLDALGVSLRLEYGDVCDRDYCERLVNSSEAEVVFHLAAVSIVRTAERDPYRAVRTNVLGTLNICEAAKRNGAVAVVASSDKAYGSAEGQRYREDMPLRPVGAYETSKACADHVARLYGAVVVRAANLYGPGDLNWSRLVPNSCRLALGGEAPQVYGDAAANQREWLYVDDACQGYLHLAIAGEPGAYNLGSGFTASAEGVAKTIARLAGAPLPVSVSKERPFYEIAAQILDSRKVNRLGWCAFTDLNEGLYKALEWYRGYLEAVA